MDVNQVVQELHEERERLEAAIASMERLAAGRGRRRGRPPKWMKQALNGRLQRTARKRGRPKPEVPEKTNRSAR